MPGRFAVGRLLLRLLSLLLLPVAASGAANDNQVEWNGVHSDETSRSPRHPGRGQSWTVTLQVFRGDITSARVRIYDGQARFHDMVWIRNAGPSGQYDVWQANIPGTQADSLFYRFEITDGADTDYFNRLGPSDTEPAHGDFLINTTELGRFPLGATVDGADTVFRVWAPNATAAAVAGTFNGWNTAAHPLSAVAGVWQGRVSGAGPGHEYRFVLENNGSHWRTDPRARRQTSSVGNSLIWNPASHDWQDNAWVTPFFEDMIVYELHLGTFAGEGDGIEHHPARFRDVVDRHLDHLVELGINVVELMPVMEFAGDLSWGYNPAFQFAPESAYGPPDDLKYLVDRCHQAGLAVILDLVFNHMGASDLAGNLLNYDGEEIYFYPEGSGYRDTPWGPRPDYGRREVREYLTETILSWLWEYHVDGFRIDGSDFIKVNTDGWRFLQDIARAADTLSPKAILIAEQLPNDPAVTRSLDSGGAGLDSQWNDLFHDHLRNALQAAAFGDPDMNALVAGMNHFDFGGVRALNYIESHDEVAVHGRVATVADGADPHSPWAYGRGKLCYGLVMFTAGIPMILQGQEFMEDRRFGDTVNQRIQWGYRDLYHDYFLACRDMTWLRRRSPALRADGNQNIYHVNEQDNVVAWHRWTPAGQDRVIVASFNNNPFDSYCLGLPLPGTWLEVFNSDAAIYGGDNRGNGGAISATGGPLHGLPHSACLTLPRMGLLVLARDPVDLTPDLDADNDGLPDPWERAHALDPNNPADASLDADSDEMSNREEFEAGTDPRSATSRLHIRSVTAEADGPVTIQWDSVPDRRYEVLAAPNLNPATWNVIGTVPGTGEPASFQDPRPAPAGSRFYRISVSP